MSDTAEPSLPQTRPSLGRRGPALTKRAAPARDPRPLGQILKDHGAVDDDQLARAFATQLGLDFVDPSALEIPQDALERLPRAVAIERGVVPVGVTAFGSLVVALSDPYDDLLVADLCGVVGSDVDRVVATAAGIEAALQAHYPEPEPEPEPEPAPEPEAAEDSAPAWAKVDLDDELPASPTTAGTVEAPLQAEQLAPASEIELEEPAPAADLPIPTETTSLPSVAAHLRPEAADDHWTVLVSGWLGNAVNAGGTELWMVPLQGQVKLETRIRGVWREVLRLPDWTADPIRRRILAAAGVGAFAPRDELPGRELAVSGRPGLTVRFHPKAERSAADALHLELLLPSLQPTLAQAGVGPDDQRRLRQWTSAREGLILLVGSTDSGVSTTLRALAGWVSTRRPTLFIGHGVLGVGSKAATAPRGDGVDGLEAALGDVDNAAQVVLIDDLESAPEAALALPLATRGKVVIAAMHGRDVAAAIARLRAAGLSDQLVLGEQLLGVFEQRAVPVLCPACSTRGPLDKDLARALGLNTESLPAQAPIEGPGCPRCGRSGRMVRRPLFTRVELAGRVLPGATDEQLHTAAARGRKVQPAEQAISLVVQGLASLRGVAAALGADVPRKAPLVSVVSQNWVGETAEETVAGDFAPTLELDDPIENLAVGLLAEGPTTSVPGDATFEAMFEERAASDDRHVLLVVGLGDEFTDKLRRALPSNLFDIASAEGFEGAIERVRRDRPTAVILPGEPARARTLIGDFRDDLSSAFLPLIVVLPEGTDATPLLEAGADEPLYDGEAEALRKAVDDLVFKLA